MKKYIIPSIIAKNQKELVKIINKVKNHSSLLQLDVMDGRFVKNQSINFEFKLPKTKCKYEAHLMVKNPHPWIEKYAKNVNMILFHIEPIRDKKEIKEIIKQIKKKKKKVGIAINPKTRIKTIKPYLKDVDQVLIMTVNPGKYGAKFLPATLKKVRELRKLKPNLQIEVDGSINDKTIKAASEAGANKFISGSYLQKSRNIKKAIGVLKGLAK